MQKYSIFLEVLPLQAECTFWALGRVRHVLNILTLQVRYSLWCVVAKPCVVLPADDGPP